MRHESGPEGSAEKIVKDIRRASVELDARQGVTKAGRVSVPNGEGGSQQFPKWSLRIGFDELNQQPHHLFGPVFLNEVAAVFDDRVRLALRPGNSFLPHRVHAPCHRIAIAEGGQKRFVPIGKDIAHGRCPFAKL